MVAFPVEFSKVQAMCIFPLGLSNGPLARRCGLSEISGNAEKILSFLADHSHEISPLLILAHDFPDPDALASAYALKFLAEKQYQIKAKIAYGGIIGRMENRAMVSILRLPVSPLKPTDLKRYRNVALIDTQPAFGNNSFPADRRATLVIDQHPFVVEPDAELAVVDTTCGATSVILAKALLMLNLEIPRKVATALAYGILADTASLSRGVNKEIIDIYVEILASVDMQALARIQHPPRSKRFFTTIAQGINNAISHRGVVVSRVGEVESPDSVAQLADFLLSYEKAVWVFCIGRYRGKLHASLRSSKANVQAGEILRDIFPKRSQAGGHDMIAGGSFPVGRQALPSEWERIESEMVQGLLRRLKLGRPKDPKCAFPNK